MLQRYGWMDEWWVAVDGAVLDGRMSLKEACGLKRQMGSRQISLLHPRAPDSIGVQWHPLDAVSEAPPQPRLAKKTAPPPVGNIASKGAPKAHSAGGVPAAGGAEQFNKLVQQVIELKADLADMQLRMNGSLSELKSEMLALRVAFEEMVDLKRFKQQLDERRRALEQSEQMLIKKAFKQDQADGSGGENLKKATKPAKSDEPEIPAKPPAPSRRSSSSHSANKADLEALLPGRPIGEEKAAAKPPPPRR